jgi:predicted metalloprotease with PDZ domain
VSAAADLTKRLKAAGESAVPLKVLRAGKPLTLQVRPAYRVTFASIEESKTEYYLGINIEAVDEALRSQLSLPAGRGVLISEVLVESPAEKAGVKKHDIVIELGGKTMDGVETLMAQVQAEKDKATTLKVLRGGKIVTLPITGAVRKAQGEAAYKDYVMQRLITDGNDNAAALGIQFLDAARLGSRGSNANADGKLLERLDRLEKEVKALREALEAANARKPN